MSSLPHLVGMVHLLPLPGSPGNQAGMSEIVATAVDDAIKLRDCGFPALLVENFGDTPFFADNVPATTIATMSKVIAALRDATDLPIGVNVLRNDGLSALAIAAANDAAFIRVNVLAGTMYTDQGPIVGRAAEILRARAALCPEVEIWADVMVKHATPPPGSEPGQAAMDTLVRGHADGLIMSGRGTGAEPDFDLMSAISSAVPDGTRLIIGSGATERNLETLTKLADTVIVGSAVKFDGVAANRVDPQRATAFVVAARASGLM